jgi:hypothetical protein
MEGCLHKNQATRGPDDQAIAVSKEGTEMTRFRVGQFVELNGVLAELYGGAIGTVLSVAPHKDGVTALDEYKIAFEDSLQLRLCRFQLTGVKFTNDEEREHATLSC